MIRRILAVDDEIHMLKLLEQVIREKTEHDLTTLNNPMEVPDILSRQHYSLVLADWKMPGLDGLGVLRWIRDNDRTEEVIIMTAFASPEFTREALQAGAFAVLSKPFHRDELLLMVERALVLRETKKELAEWKRLLGLAPYESAEAAFRNEYLVHAAGRLGWNAAAIAAETGLPQDRVQELLDNLSKPQN